MNKIIIVTSRKDELGVFGKTLEAAGKEVSLEWMRAGADALAIAAETTPDLIIVDSVLVDMDGLTLVRKLLGINAMINTALVSPLSSSEFHEATEGLGMLGNLAMMPGESDARDIFSRLMDVVGPQS
jgi:DNA-binding response OmpR family regulator